MVLYYGRRVTSPETFFADYLAGQMRATVYNAASQHLWVYAIAGWVGDPDGGTAPTGRFAVYDTDVAKNPTGRVGYSASFTAGTAYLSASGGASHEPAVEVADNGPTNAALKLFAGKRYAIAFLPTASAARSSFQSAGNIVADNEQIYSRSGLSQPPPAPFGSFSAAVEGHNSFWCVADANVAPNTPSTGLAPVGTINDLAPTFTADYRDQNAGHSGGTDRGDKLNQYKIQVRRVSDGVIFWDATYSAVGSEQTADAVSRAYGGTTLVRGTAYEWRIQQSDDFSAWSAFSAWTQFTPANLGFVTLDANPTGKILDDTPDFQGRWTHQASLSTNRVQVRVLSAGGTILQTGAEVTKTVASSASPGTLFTITFAESGLTALSWGTSYQYQIRGRDTDNLWSDWSAARSFNTDAFPTTPSGLSPSGSQIFSSLPVLAFSVTDPDDTPDPAGNLHGYLVIVDAVSVENPTLNVDGSHYVAFTPTAGLTVGTNGRATDQAYEGAGSLKVDVTASTAVIHALAGSYNDTFTPVTPLQPVRAQGKVRSNNVNVCPRFTIDWFDQSFVYLSSTHQDFYTPVIDQWNQLTFDGAIPPANAWYGRVVCVWNGLIANATGTVWFDLPRINGFREGTWNAGTSRFEYQPTALDLPFFETVPWYAFGHDETLQGANSATAVWIYATGPAISVTTPTEAQVLTSSSVSVAWTVTGGGPQVKYRVVVYADNSQTIVYDSGWITSTATSHVVPSGYVRNDTLYDLVVMAENDVPLQGSSPIRNFSIDYVDPDPVANVQVVTFSYATDPWPTAVRISWDQTTYATPTWQEYTITRRATSGPDQAEIVLARLTSPSATAYVDTTPASGATYTYGLKQVILQGLDLLDSPAVEGSASVALGGVVLSHATQGGTYRTVLRNARTREHTRQVQEAVYLPVGGGNGGEVKPLTIRSRVRYWEPEIVALLITDDWATAAQRREELETLDGQQATICFRDDEGRKVYLMIADLSIADELPEHFTARIRGRESSFREGTT